VSGSHSICTLSPRLLALLLGSEGAQGKADVANDAMVDCNEDEEHGSGRRCSVGINKADEKARAGVFFAS